MKKLAGLASVAALLFTVACGQTDAGITTAVKSKLAADDMVSAYDVEVETENKVVTLRGDVRTPEQKAHAVMIARNTDGVTDVIDQLRVNPTAATTGMGDSLDRFGDRIESGAERGAEGAREGVDRMGDAIDPDDNR